MKSLVKFLIVGVINTLIGAAIMFLSYNLLNFSYWVSSALNYIAGGIVSFFLNKHFTFQNKERSLKQVILFALSVAVCYIIAYSVAKPLIANILSQSPGVIKDNAALLTGMVLYTGLNFILQKFIVFRRKNERKINL